jgi:hypothetical protein
VHSKATAGCVESALCMKERGVNRGGEDVAPTQNTVANARCGSRVISGVHPVVTVMKPIGRGRLRIPVFPK